MNIEVQDVQDVQKLKLADLHIHTNYAYCSEDVEPSANIIRARAAGLALVAFTEHSGQLYVSSSDYWSGRFVSDTQMIKRNRDSELNRMPEYRKTLAKFRSDYVLAGVETEVDADGGLVLLEEDRDCWDIMLGAVHFLPDRYETGSMQGFMWANEMLMRGGVDILAHPLRYFAKKKLETPKEVYGPLVEMLAHYGVAAELNFHKNNNDPVFFEKCLQNNVKISFGSDAHNLNEIGSFNGYLEFMAGICPPAKLPDVLYKANKGDRD